MSEIDNAVLQSIGRSLLSDIQIRLRGIFRQKVTALAQEGLTLLDSNHLKGLSRVQKFDIIRTELMQCVHDECKSKHELAKPPLSDILNKKPVSDLELCVRSRKAMQQLNIETVGQLIQKTEVELLKAKNFGQTCLNEVKFALKNLGLSLRNNEQPQH
jgi:DNA-directed RNA polymerase alpha subunit